MRAVALGGGHGTALTLQALLGVTADVTAIVSVADDGGSSGVLRSQLDLPAVGDIRKCLVALADPSNEFRDHLEHRFRLGELDNHALGNLLLASLTESTGSLEAAAAMVGKLVHARGRVLPTSNDSLTLRAQSDAGVREGQVVISQTSGLRVLQVGPTDARPCVSAIEALREADLVVVGPGSLFTSVLAALVSPGIREALASRKGKFVFVANLLSEEPESKGFSVAQQLVALRDHRVEPDLVVAEQTVREEALTCPVVWADLVAEDRYQHDATKLARVLADLVA